MKIGIDLGGTKTEGILIDAVGKELNRKRIKTEKNYDGTIKGILSIIEDFESEILIVFALPVDLIKLTVSFLWIISCVLS